MRVAGERGRKKEVKENEKIASDNTATGGGERGRKEREREAVARRDRGQKRD